MKQQLMKDLDSILNRLEASDVIKQEVNFVVNSYFQREDLRGKNRL